LNLSARFVGMLCSGLVILNLSGALVSTGYATAPSQSRIHDVKTIQIVVQQSFGDAEPKTLPVYRTVEKILESKGFCIVDHHAVTYDAQLMIDLEGTACAGRYTGGPQYSGAKVSGKLSLHRNGGTLWSRVFAGSIQPGRIILRKFKRPTDAPFEQAFNESGFELLIRSLAYFLGDDRSIREIADAANDRRPAIRLKALEILGDIRVEHTLPTILSRLKDTDPQVRLTAVRALSLYERGETFSSVLAMLHDRDIDVRREAVRALGRIRDSRAIPSLIELLKTDAFIRETAKESLCKIGEPSVDPLIALLEEKDLPPLAREEAVEVLGELRDPRAILPLIHCLDSKDRWEQRKSLEALCAIGRCAANNLIAALGDPKPLIRQSAAEILGKLKAVEALPALTEALGDSDPGVRQQAAWALGELGDRSVVQTLENLALTDPILAVRQSASEALQKIGLP
jgi:HEAT repeat protein